MILAEIDEKSYYYLLRLLTERYEKTNDADKLAQINKLYKLLRYRSESWLSAMKED